MIIRRFAKNTGNRKELVNRISSITGVASRYTGMPLMSYEIGNFTVEKDGILAVTINEAEGGNEGAVILALRADNLIGEEISPKASETSQITSQTLDITEREKEETTEGATEAAESAESNAGTSSATPTSLVNVLMKMILEMRQVAKRAKTPSTHSKLPSLLLGTHRPQSLT